MGDLNSQQYEAVLHFMQAVNEDDYDLAVLLMNQHNFNLEVPTNPYPSPQLIPGSKDRGARAPTSSTAGNRRTAGRRRTTRRW